MTKTKFDWAISTVLALVVSTLIATPLAQADYADSKTTTVQVSIDGNTIGLSNTATNHANDALNRAFGGGNFSNDSSESELSAMYTSIDGGQFWAQAQGGIVEIDCGGGASEYYQRSSVQLTNLPAGTKDVWAFFDPAVGSGSVVKTFPHFNYMDVDAIANKRISNSASLPKLCDGTTQYVAGTPGNLVLGAGGNVRTTSGVVQNDITATSTTFDVYVPMDGESNGDTSIFLALGIVVDMGGDGVLDDTTDDVGIETWISSKPWWGPGENDSTDVLLEPCSGPGASDNPCVVNTSGVFAADGTTRLDAGYSVQLSMEGDAESFAMKLKLAPTAAISGAFAIAEDSITNIAVSWPTTGDLFGIGDLPVGSGENELNFANVFIDTPILVNPQTTAQDSSTNRWDIAESDRVVTTLIGTAKETSAAISRQTWWPQCGVEVSGGSVVSDKCGEGMTSYASDDYFVHSSVPAKMNLLVDQNLTSVAGGLVSTNGQGFAFGDVSAGFQFAVSGPSYNAANQARSAEGFYYVCIPSEFLADGFDVTAAEAAAEWEGRRDGVVVSDTAFATGTCGDGSSGLVASLNPFGYSSPLFALQPVPVIAPAPAPAPAPYSGPLPTAASPGTASAGEQITITGIRLSTITSVQIDGAAAVIVSVDKTSLIFTLPEGLEAGTKSIVLNSSYGKLTYQDSLEYKAAAPVAVVEPEADSAIVNAGSFDGYVAVYAKGHEGKTLSWKIAGKWFKTEITSNYQVFQRKTAAIGKDVKVDLYIDGTKQLSKKILTR